MALSEGYDPGNSAAEKPSNKFTNLAGMRTFQSPGMYRKTQEKAKLYGPDNTSTQPKDKN